MGLTQVLVTKKYLSETITNISSCVFAKADPIDSMVFVHNGYFRICGQMEVHHHVF